MYADIHNSANMGRLTPPDHKMAFCIIALEVVTRLAIQVSALKYTKYGLNVRCCTGCGRKKSPIWEANKFKTKEDTANVFYL